MSGLVDERLTWQRIIGGRRGGICVKRDSIVTSGI